MFDYQRHFDAYCGEHCLDLRLSFDMPEGYASAYGTFDAETKTVFINAGLLSAAPDEEKAFYLFHELRHASQHLRPGEFSEAVRRSAQYVIMYDGTCYRCTDGGWRECRLEGDEEYLTNLYLGQPHETDANAFAYRQAMKAGGDPERLRKLYSFWTPARPVPDGEYEAVYAMIDQKTAKRNE